MLAILRETTKLPKELLDIVRSFDDCLISIAEVKSPGKYGFSDWGGFIIQTTDQRIRLQIEDLNLCCESYGWEIFSMEVGGSLIANQQHFKDASIHSVGWTNTCLNDALQVDQTAFAAINITTNVGILQLLLYNVHNGYYPHNIRCSWKNYKDKQQL